MAPRTVAGRAVSTPETTMTPPSATGDGLPQLDFEDAGNRMQWLLALLSWVEQARHILDSIDNATGIDPRFAASFKEAGISYCHDFDDEVSAGVRCVLSDIRLMTRDMAAEGQALESAQRAVGARHG